jgi:CCT motif
LYISFECIAVCLEFADDSSTSVHGGHTGISNNDMIGGPSGGRNRAFSFECFAFGINADEPLPPLEQPSSSSSNIVPLSSTSYNNNNDTSVMNSYDSHNRNNNNNTQFSMMQQSQQQQQRPRGDSIIFDPVSFQDGGIHELLPGLIEQHGNNNSNMNDRNPSTTNQTTTSSIQQHHQPLPTRPTATFTTTSKKQNSSRTAPIHQPQPLVVNSNSAIQSNLSTTIKSHPQQQQQQRKSINHHHHTTPSTTSTTIHQDTAMTINTDGTTTTISLELCNKDGRIGIYLPEARIARIARFHAKRSNRIWRKRIKYDCRKKLADSRPRIKGRFVKRTDMDE